MWMSSELAASASSAVASKLSYFSRRHRLGMQGLDIYRIKAGGRLLISQNCFHSADTICFNMKCLSLSAFIALTLMLFVSAAPQSKPIVASPMMMTRDEEKENSIISSLSDFGTKTLLPTIIKSASSISPLAKVVASHIKHAEDTSGQVKFFSYIIIWLSM